MNWLVFFIGVLVGWLIEWLIDFFYWRRKWQAGSSAADACRQELEAAEAQNRKLATQLEQRQRHITDLEARLAALNARPDDLTRIEGIGPKITEILKQNGITTFAQLAEMRVDALRDLLEPFGDRFRLADPASWPEQARLAARDEWEQLHELQNRLHGGRRPQSR